jgi:hypothetical protein
LTEIVPLSALTPDPANARKHPERNRQAIRGSLKRFGPGRSIVLDGKNVIRAGNGTVQEASEAGITEVVILDLEPHQIGAVRRKDWSETEATGYVIAGKPTRVSFLALS